MGVLSSTEQEGAPICALPREVSIALKGSEIFVAGRNVADMPASNEALSKLTNVLFPCAFDRLFSFELEPTTTAQQVRTLFAQTPTKDDRVERIRIGKMPTREILRAIGKSAVGHWVRLIVDASGVTVRELERVAGQEGVPPSVVREMHPRGMPEALAFARATCAKKPCVALIFSPDPASSAALLGSALAAVSASATTPLELDLRDPGAGNDSNDVLAMGNLEPAVIQRIVRAAYGQFRVCYEAGLARDPKLEGRVQTRFVIGRDGRVTQSSADADPGLTDPQVVQCVVDAMSKLHFPKPRGGIVTVVYPIMLSPG